MMSSSLLYTSGITNPYTKVCRIFMVLRFAIEKSTGLSLTFSSLPTAINPTRRKNPVTAAKYITIIRQELNKIGAE